MALTGKQKAAMLLMSLDAVSATELLKGVDSEVVQELAVELAYLDAAGLRDSKESFEVATQFCSSLQPQKGFQFKSFLDTMLKSTVGSEKAEYIQTQIENLLQKRDPFMSIRSVKPKTLATVLQSEHPQAVAVVLAELPTKKSSEVLSFLEEEIRVGAIGRMTGSNTITLEAKTRIAEMVCNKIDAIAAAAASDSGGSSDDDGDESEGPLRKVAVILRNLGKELRDGMLESLKEKDSEAGKEVTRLMVIWSDIPEVTDRSMQEALRGIDSAKLAMALIKADETIAAKIKSNISERAAATIDEETSLMSAPKKEEIEEAREEVVSVLRETNESGDLDFVEEDEEENE